MMSEKDIIISKFYTCVWSQLVERKFCYRLQRRKAVRHIYIYIYIYIVFKDGPYFNIRIFCLFTYIRYKLPVDQSPTATKAHDLVTSKRGG
jgi:hypothetical protein